MEAAIQQFPEKTSPEDVLAHIPSARVGATRLAHMGYSVERIDIDRDGPRCTVMLQEAGSKAAPDLQPLINACAWLLGTGYLVLRAEWLGPVKNPRIWIARPASRTELDPALVATGRVGTRLVHTWCAVRFACEIRWEEVE